MAIYSFPLLGNTTLLGSLLPDCRHLAIQLVLQARPPLGRGGLAYSAAEVAERLGTTTHSIHAWQQKYKELKRIPLFS